MAISPLSLLVLAGLLGSSATEDLQKKVFVFPTASNNAAVFLKAPLRRPLTSFTVCLRSYTLLTRGYGLFSYATRRNYNEILLYKVNPNEYSLYLGGSTVSFNLPEKQGAESDWEHLCVSWDSATGLVELWVDDHLLPRVGLKKGYAINPEASIVLGQDQDSFGGGFDINQSLVGEISDVYMWDRVLSADEVNLVWNDHRVDNSLIDWRDLDYETRGYVVLHPPFFQATD
uniref:Pentraxin family member n=1 Tax=Pogona vitticeps TaxID=103695 RepID=A0A6J0SM05_9SAUR